jgi:hypothetical protein
MVLAESTRKRFPSLGNIWNARNGLVLTGFDPRRLSARAASSSLTAPQFPAALWCRTPIIREVHSQKY